MCISYHALWCTRVLKAAKLHRKCQRLKPILLNLSNIRLLHAVFNRPGVSKPNLFPLKPLTVVNSSRLFFSKYRFSMLYPYFVYRYSMSIPASTPLLYSLYLLNNQVPLWSHMFICQSVQPHFSRLALQYDNSLRIKQSSFFDSLLLVLYSN